MTDHIVNRPLYDEAGTELRLTRDERRAWSELSIGKINANGTTRMAIRIADEDIDLLVKNLTEALAESIYMRDMMRRSNDLQGQAGQ